MSILLDAVKKSGQSRNQHNLVEQYEQRNEHHQSPQAPTASNGQTTIIQPDTQTPWFLFALTINILLILTAVFFWYELKDQNNNTLALMLQNSSINQNASTPELGDFGIVEKSNNSIKVKKKQELPQNLALSSQSPKQLESKPSPKQETLNDSKIKEIAILDEPIRPLLSKPKVKRSTNKINNKKIYALEELPQNIATDFPILEYSAHLYSKSVKDARMIIANDNQYSENDYINNDLKIEQITNDGVRYLFKGYKVYINVASQITR